MRYLLYTLLALLGLVLLAFLLQVVASETGEVVVLTTQTAEGPKETRLWVVELDGTQYLRAGLEAGWYRRLTAVPDVRLTRDGATASYRAESRAELVVEVNRLMRAKYGWRDAVIELFVGSRDDAVPIALVPET